MGQREVDFEWHKTARWHGRQYNWDRTRQRRRLEGRSECQSTTQQPEGEEGRLLTKYELYKRKICYENKKRQQQGMAFGSISIINSRGEATYVRQGTIWRPLDELRSARGR